MDEDKVTIGYFQLIYEELSTIELYAPLDDQMLGQLQLLKMDIRFMKALCCCFETWDHTIDEVSIERLRAMILHPLRVIWLKEHKGSSLSLLLERPAESWGLVDMSIQDFRSAIFELEGKIQQSKRQFEGLFYWSFRCKPLMSYNIFIFLNSILENLNDLVTYKSAEIVPFKKQIETFKEKLFFLWNYLELTMDCTENSKVLGEFDMFVQAFANDAACLTFLYWAKDANDESAYETNSILYHLLQKIKPSTPDVARLYFETLTAIYVRRCDSRMFGQTVLSFVDLFLEDPMTPLKDDFQILRDDIVFLLTFLNDPPDENPEELMCSQIDIHFWETMYNLLPFDDMDGGKKAFVGDFMMKIGMINANIRLIYCKFQNPVAYDIPMVISPRFLDFLIQNLINLKERMISDRNYAPFAKYKIIKIEEELVSLGPFFNHIFDLQDELNETWLDLVHLVHVTEYVINSCITSWFAFDRPIWYHLAYLADILDRIKVVKAELKKIKENTVHNARCLPCSTDFISTLFEQPRPSEVIEIVVGFEDEVEKITGMLTRGSMSLDIVSIVGMGGLGKTTLAKKVYGCSLVKCNFNVFAFCVVSQDHNTRRLLLYILHDIMGDGKRIFDMTDDDLAHQLWKCLSRQKYLIVLDDIWNESAWNKVKSSFPDDKNGSRVMLTTRSHEVANKCKINCSPHQLRFLSEFESWELLRKKVFHNVLYKVGNRIAKNCKGLPLAVTVIAGFLLEQKNA